MKIFTSTGVVGKSYPLVILVSSVDVKAIFETYVYAYGIPHNDVAVIALYGGVGKKPTAKEIKQFIAEELQPGLDSMETQYIVCASSDYFKALTKLPKADANFGYVSPSVFGSQQVVYVPSYATVMYDPIKVSARIRQGIEAVIEHASGSYAAPGTGIIKYAAYPQTDEEVVSALADLLQRNVPLTVDIEAFSLKHHSAGIGTITFCWSEHEGIAFSVDYIQDGVRSYNALRRRALKEFFETFTEKLIYHNISYDAYVLIYQLFMENITDTEGLLYGLDVMLKNWDDTKLITYLATNTCAGNELSLKVQAQEFAGNYAESEITDITKIPVDRLLTYNLVDGLSTWFVHKKWYDKMVNDQQLDIYENLFKPAIVDIIQMQLTGLPVNIDTVGVVKNDMLLDQNKALLTISASPLIQEFTHILNEQYVEKRNSEWKVKRITVADANEEFNPNSGPQLQKLLYTFLGLPVISTTESKLPSTDGDTLKALVNHTDKEPIKELLRAILDYKLVNKILTDFIPALETSVQGPDGWHYLFGNLNLGGTVSGRLSASDPNLSTLPANSKYAKHIKDCIEPPPGWLFCGLDFFSLEDKISALTTKDPNKIKVYTDGFDGHCLRAFSYFGDQMPDIVETVESVNSIATKYKSLRQDSKAPSFALTYQGTYITLMKNCGFSEKVSKSIESRYHELYKVSDDWIAARLKEASKTGYVTCAFGLRVRTPLLAQTILGNRKTPYQAAAESRTAGNALGQSWCLLNTRAGVECNRTVRKSKYRLDIRPSMHIHDAQYFMVKDDLDTLMFLNEHLVKAVEWQDHPDIYHPTVKLGGELSVFSPTWKTEIGIPNRATEEQILAVVDAHAKKHP